MSIESTFAVKACLLYNRLFGFRLTRDSLMINRIEAEKLRKIDVRADDLRYAAMEYKKAHKFLEAFDSAFCLDGRRVLDFGCRFGGSTLWYAQQGAKEVIGVDVQLQLLEVARQFVQQMQDGQEGRSGTERRTASIDFRLGEATRIPVDDESVDVILSEDVVEHLQDPLGIFREWMRILARDGRIVLRFGPLWLHPHGVHLWEVFPGPWSHVLFSERTCVAVRNIAKGYNNTADHWTDMNKMTLCWFEQLVRESTFKVEFLRVRPAWGLKPLLTIPRVREYFAAGVDCVLRKA